MRYELTTVVAIDTDCIKVVNPTTICDHGHEGQFFEKTWIYSANLILHAFNEDCQQPNVLMVPLHYYFDIDTRRN